MGNSQSCSYSTSCTHHTWGSFRPDMIRHSLEALTTWVPNQSGGWLWAWVYRTRPIVYDKMALSNKWNICTEKGFPYIVKVRPRTEKRTLQKIPRLYTQRSSSHGARGFQWAEEESGKNMPTRCWAAQSNVLLYDLAPHASRLAFQMGMDSYFIFSQADDMLWWLELRAQKLKTGLWSAAHKGVSDKSFTSLSIGKHGKRTWRSACTFHSQRGVEHGHFRPVYKSTGTY